MHIHNEKSGRATLDLDIAVAISDWDKYLLIEKGIVKIEGFEKDYSQKQRFIYHKILRLDIVPFGDIMKEDDKIYWPPDESIAMSVLGFKEVSNDVRKVEFDPSTEIKVASLAGIFILKIVAWSERYIIGNKDADDIGFILNNYYYISEQKAVKEHYDIFEVEKFNIHIAAAQLLGRDIRKILSVNDDTRIKITRILQSELNKGIESPLINQIIDTNKIFDFDLAYDCMFNILNEINS
jgi:predicted nucleotidyltransferase